MMIKNLTVANIKKIEGMVRREDLDFTDDGNRFRGFEYKGMPITTLRSGDETYLSIRVDYLDNEFTFNEWIETEEYQLTHEFNGVSEIDLEKLIENLERIIAKVNEMNAKAKEEVIDMSEVESKLTEEIEYAESVVNNFKSLFKWYDASSYVLSRLIDYLKSIERQIEHFKSINLTTLTRKEKKHMVESLSMHGYVKFREDNFYLTELNKAISK